MGIYQKGEKTAALLFKKKGFVVVFRNYKSRLGEIDLIAKKGGLLVFCEVKTRNNLKYGYPYEAVNSEKQSKIKKMAKLFIHQKKPGYEEIRFDVVSILHNEGQTIVEHIENAFM